MEFTATVDTDTEQSSESSPISIPFVSIPHPKNRVVHGGRVVADAQDEAVVICKSPTDTCFSPDSEFVRKMHQHAKRKTETSDVVIKSPSDQLLSPCSEKISKVTKKPVKIEKKKKANRNISSLFNSSDELTDSGDDNDMHTIVVDRSFSSEKLIVDDISNVEVAGIASEVIPPPPL